MSCKNRSGDIVILREKHIGSISVWIIRSHEGYAGYWRYNVRLLASHIGCTYDGGPHHHIYSNSMFEVASGTMAGIYRRNSVKVFRFDNHD
jgi:hypothetical protein